MVLVLLLLVLFPNRPPDSKTILVGTSQGGVLGFASDIIRALNLDSKCGVSLDFKYFSPEDAENALLNGAVDVAYFSPLSTVRANNIGHNLRLFGPALNDHYSVVVQQDSPYTSLDQLRGKKLGILSRTTGGYSDLSIIWAKTGGSVEKDFILVTGKPPILVNFLLTGAVDAILLFEPQVTNLIADEKARRLISLQDLAKQAGLSSPILMLAFAAQEEWLNQHRPQAAGLLCAYYSAFDLIRSDPSLFLPTRVKEILGIENPAVISALQELLPPLYPTVWNQQTRTEILDLLQEAQQLQLIDSHPNDKIFEVLDATHR